jgi:hypothetical protein
MSLGLFLQVVGAVIFGNVICTVIEAFVFAHVASKITKRR